MAENQGVNESKETTATLADDLIVSKLFRRSEDTFQHPNHESDSESMDIPSFTPPPSLACLPPDVTTEGHDSLANLYDEIQNPISESSMSLKPLKDYMTALFKTQSSPAKNKFEVFHVCPDLNDIVSSEICTFSTPIHVIKNISEYSLTAYVEKKESDNLYFYLEYMSHTEQTNTCFKWSVSVYNTNRDDYLQLGETVLYLNDDQQITSEKLCAPVDTIHIFLNNSQFIIVWLIELVSSCEEFPISLIAFENVRSSKNISDETHFESRIDTFFSTVLQQNQELTNESNEMLAINIDQSQKQLLDNLKSVEEIKNDVSEMDKRLNDFFSNDRNSFNLCGAVSKTGTDFVLRPILETENAQTSSYVSVKLNEKLGYKEKLQKMMIQPKRYFMTEKNFSQPTFTTGMLQLSLEKEVRPKEKEMLLTAITDLKITDNNSSSNIIENA